MMRRLAILALAVTVSSCGGPPASPAGAVRVTRADSAGIEIVTSPVPPAGLPVFATLDSAPDLRIGSLDGPKEEQFGSSLRLAPLSDGAVAVLDVNAAEVRVFGPDGGYLHTDGRKGEGPGELSAPVAVAALPGDTLAAYDYRTARVTRFQPGGALARTVTLAHGGYGTPYRASFFSDGSLVGQVFYTGSDRYKESSDKLTFIVDSAALVVFAADGSFSDTVDILTSSENLRTMRESGQGVIVWTTSSPFGRRNVFAASPDGVWSGFGDHFALHLLDPEDGSVTRILRVPGMDRPLADAEVKQIFDQDLSERQTPEERRRIREVFDLSPHPALRPAYDRLVVDDQARVWLREWPGARTDTLRWLVFARDGAPLGSVSVPGSFRLMAVRRGQAWGVARDDLDVPYVVRYTLQAGGGGASTRSPASSP